MCGIPGRRSCNARSWYGRAAARSSPRRKSTIAWKRSRRSRSRTSPSPNTRRRTTIRRATARCAGPAFPSAASSAAAMMRPWRLAAAVSASAVVVLGAPYIGQIRGAVQQALPGQYRAIVIGIIAVATVAALAAALVRIRERRLARYGLLGAALAAGALCAVVMASDDPLQNAVERFHLVQYALVAFLYYRVWQHRGDAAALVLPMCAGLVTGIFDEWLQWFVPERVGEWRDIVINTVGAGCGLLFGLASAPLRTPVVPPLVPARRLIARALAVALVAAGIFTDSVHLGYEIAEPGVGTFRSRFTAGALTAAAADRAGRWHREPPATAAGFSREDQYLTEGMWHVQRRNAAAGAGDSRIAWQENRILEIFFDPVLSLS